MPQSLMNSAAIRICSLNESKIVELINKSLSENNIEAEIKSLKLSQQAEMIKAEVTADKINYEQIVIRFLPQIIGLIPNNENTRVFTNAIDIVGSDIDSAVKALLENIDDEKKEQLAKLFANHYSPQILSMLNKLNADNGVTAKIVDFSIS